MREKEATIKPTTQDVDFDACACEGAQGRLPPRAPFGKPTKKRLPKLSPIVGRRVVEPSEVQFHNGPLSDQLELTSRSDLFRINQSESSRKPRRKPPKSESANLTHSKLKHAKLLPLIFPESQVSIQSESQMNSHHKTHKTYPITGLSKRQIVQPRKAFGSRPPSFRIEETRFSSCKSHTNDSHVTAAPLAISIGETCTRCLAEAEGIDQSYSNHSDGFGLQNIKTNIKGSQRVLHYCHNMTHIPFPPRGTPSSNEGSEINIAISSPSPSQRSEAEHHVSPRGQPGKPQKRHLVVTMPNIVYIPPSPAPSLENSDVEEMSPVPCHENSDLRRTYTQRQIREQEVQRLLKDVRELNTITERLAKQLSAGSESEFSYH